MPQHTAAKRAPAVPVSFDSGFPAGQTLGDHAIEISIRGKWIPVPALQVRGYTIVMTGHWLKLAAIHDEDWLENEFSEPEACIASVRDFPQSARPDIFTFTQKVPSSVPRYDYPMERDSLAVATFDSFEQWWNELPRETRKNVRRAQKRGVVLTTHDFDDELVRGIAAIQNERPIRQGRRYQHYGKTLEQVRRDHHSFIQRSDFITAHFEGELIGVLKLVYCGNVASIMQLNTLVSHFDKRPANALLARAVELSAERGISHLVYGKYNYGNKDECGLREFKCRHAFHNLYVPRYYVPLTRWGKFCVDTHLYRDLHQMLPGWLIKTAVDLRAKWYERTAH